ncbi:MAG TPA: TetR/AcrR family transcriptional regulator, partial [Gemmatimonadaceae bacterium]|nr:TetR/AcrR family transcriptional regulator [Gemmatimonadaceae bacterium]
MPAAPTVSRDQWLAAAVAALAEGGVTAVRVEVLAARLGVTKGSFYWHFRDRGALLEGLLSLWEDETIWLVSEASLAPTPRDRLVRFFELVAERRDYPPDVEILAWARHDIDVAKRVEATERRRLDFITGELRASGFDDAEAARRGRAAYLATQGWVEWVSRGMERYDSLPDFTRHLFDLILAPAAPATTVPKGKLP